MLVNDSRSCAFKPGNTVPALSVSIVSVRMRRREAAQEIAAASPDVASRVTAGAARILDAPARRTARPDRYAEPRRFETIPSQPGARA